MKMIAVIPARGGSKRLPRKNIIDFEGKPIIAYTIEAAQKTQLFERIIVSSEDQETLEIAQALGAEIDVRPANLAADTSRVVDVCLHLIDMESAQGRNYDIFCCLYPTAPLRSSGDIKNTVGLVQPGQCDFAMGVTQYDFPPVQALRQNPDGFLQPMWPELCSKQSQQISPLVVDNGSTYAASVPEFISVKSFYGPTLKGYFMPRLRSVDIDVAEDLEIARLYARETGID